MDGTDKRVIVDSHALKVRILPLSFYFYLVIFVWILGSEVLT